MAENIQAVILPTLLDNLADLAKLKSLDITPWWNFSKSGKHVAIEAYDLGGFAHVCCIYSGTIFGVTRGETLILTPYSKDMPLFIVDYFRKMKDESLTLEFYDLQIQPIDLYDVGMSAPHYQDLPEMTLPTGFHDKGRMAPSYGVKGRDCTHKMKEIADYTLRGFLQVLDRAQPCDETRKREIIASYVEALVASDSSVMDFYKKVLPPKDFPTFASKVLFGLRHNVAVED